MDSNNKKPSKSFCSKLLTRLVEVYFVLMKDRAMPTSYALVLIIIMAFQTIGHLVYKDIGFSSENSTYSAIYTAVQVPRVYPIVEKYYGATAYWVLQYFYFFLIIAYIVQFIYIAYSIKKGRFCIDFPITLLRTLSTLFYWVLITPMAEHFASVFRCPDGHHAVALRLRCWHGAHILHSVLASLGLLLLVLVCTLVAFFFNESQCNSPDALARLDMNVEVPVLFYRVALAVLTVVLAESEYSWVLVAVDCVGSFAFTVAYLKYFFFYHKAVSCCYGICTMSYCWFSINAALVRISSDYKYSGLTLFLGVLIIVPLLLNIRDRFVHSILFSFRHNQIPSEYHLDFHAKQVLDIANRRIRTQRDNTFLLGFVASHNSQCANSECPLNSKDDLYLPVDNSRLKFEERKCNDRVLVLHILKGMYESYAKKHVAKCSLHLSYSSFVFNNIGNLHLAIIQLYLAERTTMSYQQLFSVYRSKKFIEAYLVNRYNKKAFDDERHSLLNLDVTVVIQFEDLYAELLKAIEKSVGEYIEFWGQLESPVPDLNSLHKIGLNVTTCNKQADNIWKQLTRINSSHQKAMKNYGQYLKDIRNDEEASAELLDKLKAEHVLMNEYVNDFDVMFADDTAIVVINAGGKENQGEIVRTNTGIANLFKYNPAEIIGQDVSILMPSIIGAHHGYFLEKYFKTAQETLVNNERELYALHRAGYLICILEIVKLVPSLEEGVQYIALMRQHKKNDDFILTDEHGKIDSMSQQLHGHFEFEHVLLQKSEVYVQFFCPELLSVQVDASGNASTPLESATGYLDMQFVVPKEFRVMVETNQRRLAVEQIEKESCGELKLNVGKGSGGTLPKSVKKVAQCLYGDEYKEQVRKDENLLRKALDYEQAEVKGNWTVEIKNLNFGKGRLKLKVFRIIKQKDVGDSDKFIGGKSTYRPLPRASPLNANTQAVKRTEELKTPLNSRSNTILVPNAETKPYLEGTESQTDVPQSPAKGKNENCDDASRLVFDDASEMGNAAQSEWSPLFGGLRSPEAFREHCYLQKALSNSSEQNEVIQGFLKCQEVQDNTEVLVHRDGKRETSAKEETRRDLSFEDDTGSIASCTSSLLQQIRALKSTLYEDYCPQSVRRLTHAARIVLLALLAVVAACSCIEKFMYSKLEKNVLSMGDSRKRMVSTTSMGFCARILTLTNPRNSGGMPIINLEVKSSRNYHLDGLHGEPIEGVGYMDYRDWALYCLEQSAKRGKDSQNALSTNASNFRKKYYDRITPKEVEVRHTGSADIADTFTLDCWSAVTTLVIHALKVRDMSPNTIVADDPSVFYILHNSFNGVLDAVRDAVEAVHENSKDAVGKNNGVFLALTVVASVSLALSLGFLLRVIIKVNKNKEEILKLFLDIPKLSVREQFERCKAHFCTYQDVDRADHEEQLPAEEDKDAKLENRKEETDALVEEPAKKKCARKSKRKYREYRSNILLTVVGFAFFAGLLEAYFLAFYLEFRSSSYSTIEMMEELGALYSTAFLSSFLFKAFQEYVATKGKGTLQGMDPETYMLSIFDEFIIVQANFLQQHLENRKRNTKAYNNLFGRVVYASVCDADYLTAQDLADCSKYPILENGLHSATIAYWDVLRKFVDGFTLAGEEERDDAEIRRLLVHSSIDDNERMNNRYFTRAYKALFTMLSQDIIRQFDREEKLTLVLSIVFAVCVALIYWIAWNLFVETTRTSLWVTKCMLGIIPIKVILEVKNIKDFLVSSSKRLIISS